MSFEEYVEGYRVRARTEREAVARVQREAGEAATRAARALVARFSPRRLLLIGSLSRGTARPGSDIDFAVEGLPAELIAEAEQVACEAAGMPVDLMRLETMDAGWRAHHERFGERIHERR